MANMNDQPMTKEKRQEKIIDIIRSNKYCNKQTVVNELKDVISRATVFDLLRELIKIGAVKTYSENNQKKNARDYKLFVAEDNPLVSVRLELEEFESAYFDLFNKAFYEVEPKLRRARSEAKDPTIQDNLRSQSVGLAMNLWEIFYSMVDAYLFRFLLTWSQKISDQKVLQQLYSMIFSKIVEMQLQLSEGFKSATGRDIEWFLDKKLIQIRFGTGVSNLTRYLDSFKGLGMEKEIERVIDSLWKIFGDLRPYVFTQARTYDWPFEYGKDDWRKLVKFYREHRKSTLTAKVGQKARR